jgi:hypothetical protein
MIMWNPSALPGRGRRRGASLLAGVRPGAKRRSDFAGSRIGCWSAAPAIGTGGAGAARWWSRPVRLPLTS